MNSNSMTDWPWNRFKEFIGPEVDRFVTLKRLIEEGGLVYSINTTAGNRHFFISSPQPEKEFLRRRLTILVAHYDRFPGSPGANDNSAAVFILVETAVKLQKEKISNWLIIFTDKEELINGQGIRDQGAYSLALNIKEKGLENARIFNFDACGVGDTLIISTTTEFFLKNEARGEKIRNSIKELRENALETARDLRMVKVLLAPTPFSDDIGFLRAGIAVQTITMLPSEECSPMVSILRRDPSFAEALVKQNVRTSLNQKHIPETWRSLNSPSDSFLRLTPQHYRSVQRFAEALCK